MEELEIIIIIYEMNIHEPKNITFLGSRIKVTELGVHYPVISQTFTLKILQFRFNFKSSSMSKYIVADYCNRYFDGEIRALIELNRPNTSRNKKELFLSQERNRDLQNCSNTIDLFLEVATHFVIMFHFS